MKNENVCALSAADFKRAVGVQRDIFDIMLEEVKKNIRNFGRPPKLSRTDQVLLTLMCWREVSYRNFLWNQRVSSLQDNQKNRRSSDLKSVLLDASEQPAGHPKKGL